METLNEQLKNVLPKDEEFEIYHLKSPSREVCGFKNRKYNSCDFVIKCSHFLSLAYKGKIFFAIDLNIYFEVLGKFIERTLFISKADTNGFLENSNVKISLIIETFISYLLKISPRKYLRKVVPLVRRYKNIPGLPLIYKKTSTASGFKILSKRYLSHDSINVQHLIKDHESLFKLFSIDEDSKILTKISLFTRPEPHYLFTSSGSNSKKHLLSGEQLLKWWLKIIDNVAKQEAIFIQDENLFGTLQLPGEENGFVDRRYLTNLSNFWRTGTIYGSYSDSLFKIPIFHDDPKTRFLKDLMLDDKYDRINMKQFWTDLEVRQEFRSGIVVGVIGVSGESSFKNLQSEMLDRDVVLATSKQKYKQIKSYIVGEEYDNDQGAIDARDNTRAIWLRYNKLNFTIKGKLEANEYKKPNATGEINVLKFRKKN